MPTFSNLLYTVKLLHFLNAGWPTDCFFIVRTTDPPYCGMKVMESTIQGQTLKVMPHHHQAMFLFVHKKNALGIFKTQVLDNMSLITVR